MYHALEDGARARWRWAVTRQAFAAQLDLLQELGCVTPTVSELVATPAPAKRSVAITFDDGYVDNLAAAEELRRRGMRATWYVVVGCLGHRPGWKADGGPTDRLMSASELRELQAAGMEIGSHTMSHQRLTSLAAGRRQDEIEASRTMLEDALGSPVHAFAYPYGDFDADSAAAVRAAGYSSACTTQPGWALRDGDAFRIRRLSVFNDDGTARFARKLAFASHDAGWSGVARYAWRRLRHG
ncbi:putative hydrolase [Rubrivivax gelatinosus IL144]|uniref:Putative hydrolase n=2 Tax=Rubrivivax gelatinosus TaxID=28068 RepID=I0HL91_RUBGI|nr:putative hydrolase [Rubrivivax gelatinosus IL144]